MLVQTNPDQWFAWRELRHLKQSEPRKCRTKAFPRHFTGFHIVKSEE